LAHIQSCDVLFNVLVDNQPEIDCTTLSIAHNYLEVVIVKKKKKKKMAEDREDVPQATLTVVIKEITIRCCLMLLWLPVSLVCLPLFLFGLSIWGLPPIIPSWSRFWKYLVAVFTEGTREDNIPMINRVMVFLTVLYALINAPLVGICWFIDELMFPSYQRKADIKELIFFNSPARSGSTQLAQYIEEDEENFVVPKAGEVQCPFIWMWKLNIQPKNFTSFRPVVCSNTLSEKNKRHNASMDKTNTMDALEWHFGFTSSLLGIKFFKWGYPAVAHKGIPIDQQYCDDLLLFIECISKKIYYHRGKPSQRVLVKGHFLTIARSLEHQYPEAKFFTVIRDPM